MADAQADTNSNHGAQPASQTMELDQSMHVPVHDSQLGIEAVPGYPGSSRLTLASPLAPLHKERRPSKAARRHAVVQELDRLMAMAETLAHTREPKKPKLLSQPNAASQQQPGEALASTRTRAGTRANTRSQAQLSQVPVKQEPGSAPPKLHTISPAARHYVFVRQQRQQDPNYLRQKLQQQQQRQRGASVTIGNVIRVASSNVAPGSIVARQSRRHLGLKSVYAHAFRAGEPNPLSPDSGEVEEEEGRTGHTEGARPAVRQLGPRSEARGSGLNWTGWLRPEEAAAQAAAQQQMAQQAALHAAALQQQQQQQALMSQRPTVSGLPSMGQQPGTPQAAAAPQAAAQQQVSQQTAIPGISGVPGAGLAAGGSSAFGGMGTGSLQQPAQQPAQQQQQQPAVLSPQQKLALLLQQHPQLKQQLQQNPQMLLQLQQNPQMLQQLMHVTQMKVQQAQQQQQQQQAQQQQQQQQQQAQQQQMMQMFQMQQAMGMGMGGGVQQQRGGAPPGQPPPGVWKEDI